MLASEKYAHKLEENVAMQREYGVKNKILTGEEIQKMYPWLKTSDIKLGTFYFNIPNYSFTLISYSCEFIKCIAMLLYKIMFYLLYYLFWF